MLLFFLFYNNFIQAQNLSSLSNFTNSKNCDNFSEKDCQNKTKETKCHTTNPFCNCPPYYFSIDELNYQNCTYNKLSKKTAFLLSFFMGPTGMDQLYMGSYLLGLLKLLSPLLLLLAATILYIKGKNKEEGGEKLMLTAKIIELMCFVLVILWWLIDWILILSNFYKDENNVYLFWDI